MGVDIIFFYHALPPIPTPHPPIHSHTHIPLGKDTGTGRKRPKKVSFSAGSCGIPTLNSSTWAIVNA